VISCAPAWTHDPNTAPTTGIVVLATATDPQGGDNLRDVLQTIGVFPDERCEGDAILLQDDLVDSGVEESFGIAASASSPLFAEIAASTTWPVSVDFSDLDGNRVTAHVIARIIPVDQGVVAAVASRTASLVSGIAPRRARLG
jgi:hypothetical protein